MARSRERGSGRVGLAFLEPAFDERLCHVPAVAAAAAGAAVGFELLDVMNAIIHGLVNVTVGDGMTDADEHGGPSSALLGI